MVRKPPGFIEKLKAGKNYLGDPEVEASLDDIGFVAVPQHAPTEILAAEGDLSIGMKDGVEYTVRFGGAAAARKGDSGEKKDKGASAKDAKKSNLERVVFVTARFNPDLIPKPAIKPLPEAKKPEAKKPEATKPEDKKPEGKAPDAKAPDAKAPDKKPADEAPTTAPKADEGSRSKIPDAKAGDKPADAPKGSQANSHLSGELLALADAADDVKKPDDAKKSDDTKKPDAPKAADDKKPAADAKPKPADTKPAETKPSDKKPAVETPAVPKPKSDTELADEEAARDAERKEIERENRQAQDQYDDTVKKGKAHAKELNNRFADWYYFISEDDYKKVHVGLSDIVKKKPEPENTGAGLGPLPQSPFDKGGFHLPHP